MTASIAQKSHRRIRASQKPDFIPNLDLRSRVIIAVLGVGALAAQAQTTAPPQESTVSVTAAAERPAERMIHTRSTGNPLDAAFRRADTNGDGQLSRKEAEHFPMLSHRFDTIDGDGDSFLSREEFDQAIGN